ncbi:three prime repair exonuclease [Cichlidogyrus casuarinus]|uniref:Three prime repair exonuclease n=1 Tax=Cichlidogyrus casuarinus TaxID=1844966 RepID=A0ABD2Q9V0_9PLAT
MSLNIGESPLLASSIVFLDLETTGLHNKPRITELCLIAVDRFSIEQTEPNNLRIVDKLVLTFNPRIEIEPMASKISNISASQLCRKKDFDSDTCTLIDLYLKRLDPPIILLAHNGFAFDFPILKSELFRVDASIKLVDCKGDPILCADSKKLFGALYSELPFQVTEETLLEEKLSDMSVSKKSTKSLKLTDIHTKVFGAVQENAHSAEADCFAILNLVLTISFNACSWLDSNNLDFNSGIKARYETYADESLFPLKRGEFPYELTDTQNEKSEISAFRLDYNS